MKSKETTRRASVEMTFMLTRKFGEADMQDITEDQIMRQDFVDNQIFDLVKLLIPSSREIEWDIEMIGDIRDTIQHWLVDKYGIVDELEFYP
jgi:hypothetical protein